MKKQYLSVGFEIVEFDCEDVITTSGGSGYTGGEGGANGQKGFAPPNETTNNDDGITG